MADKYHRPILYSFRRCPFAIRARMALDAATIKVEHREVWLRKKPEAMLAASPKGTVPVLVVGDDQVLEESLDIMIWALKQHDPDNWLRDTTSQADRIDHFLTAFKPRLDRYKYASRYSDSADRGQTDAVERDQALNILLAETEMLSRQAHLEADKPSLVDVALFPFVRQYAGVEPEWWKATAPKPLQTWLAAFLATNRFQRVMTKHPVWNEN